MGDLVKQAREALNGVTPGPWEQSHRSGKDGMWRTQVYPANDVTNEIATLSWHVVKIHDGMCTDRAENAAFIAAARDLVPAMADRIESLEAANAAMRKVLWMADEWMKHGGDECTAADEFRADLDAANSASEVA